MEILFPLEAVVCSLRDYFVPNQTEERDWTVRITQAGVLTEEGQAAPLL